MNKVGRPKIKKECLTNIVSVALTESEAKQVYSSAHRERVSVSRWIRIRLGLGPVAPSTTGANGQN